MTEEQNIRQIHIQVIRDSIEHYFYILKNNIHVYDDITLDESLKKTMSKCEKDINSLSVQYPEVDDNILNNYKEQLEYYRQKIEGKVTDNTNDEREIEIQQIHNEILLALSFLEEHIYDYNSNFERLLNDNLKAGEKLLKQLAEYPEIELDVLNDYANKLYNFRINLMNYNSNYNNANGFLNYNTDFESDDITTQQETEDNNTSYIKLAAALVVGVVLIKILFK